MNSDIPVPALSADDLARVEESVRRIAAKQEAGNPLTPLEIRCAETLTAMATAEAEARNAFSFFYAALPAPGESGAAGGSVSLPVEVAAKVNRWVEMRRAWDALSLELLAAPLPKDGSPLPVRRGKRTPQPILPPLLRVPAATTAKDALSLLFAPHLWQTDPSGEAVTAQVHTTQVRVECDTIMDFGPEKAIQQIARYGPSAAQTFLTMAGLWLQENPQKSHETYMTVYASDLLRFQGRKETPRGGYHRDDLVAKGRDVYFLSRISVPRSEVVVYEDGKRTVKTLSVGRLLSLESLDAVQDDGGANEPPTDLIRFRYHLSRDVFDWIGGDTPQYARISSRLLSYHSVRQKYQILLGFCLAYYDRVNRKSNQETRCIRLPALLDLAAVALPQKRIAEFLTSIEDALNDLSRDGVIPALRLQKPNNWHQLIASRKSREIIQNSIVEFPRLLPEPARAIAASNRI